MKVYRRILVPIPADGRAEILLQRAAEVVAANPGRARLLVVRVLDTRGGFESDGPAGLLPGDRAARRLPDAKQRLELLLARGNLSWAEAQVTWGEPKAVLAEAIREWSPDLVVTCAGQLPQGIELGTDVLSVGCRGLFGRLADAFHPPAAAGHA